MSQSTLLGLRIAACLLVIACGAPPRFSHQGPPGSRFLFPPKLGFSSKQYLLNVASVSSNETGPSCGRVPKFALCQPDVPCVLYPDAYPKLGPQITVDQTTTLRAIQVHGRVATTAVKPHPQSPFCSGPSLVGVRVNDAPRRLSLVVFQRNGFCYPDRSTTEKAIDEIQKRWVDDKDITCFTEGEAASLKSSAITRLPMPPAAVLSQRYSLTPTRSLPAKVEVSEVLALEAGGSQELKWELARTFGYVDLQPGMRVRVDYGSPVRYSSEGAGYGGSGPVVFHVSSAGVISPTRLRALVMDPFLTVMRPHVLQQVERDAIMVAGTPDLFEDGVARPFMRVFYGQLKRNDSKPTSRPWENAVLVQTSSAADLEKVTKAFNTSSAEITKACGRATGVLCFVFRHGGVPIPEIIVHVNHAERWVPVGTRVRNIMEVEVDAAQFVDTSSLATPRICRDERGTCRPVVGERDELLDLLLVKGDRIQW